MMKIGKEKILFLIFSFIIGLTLTIQLRTINEFTGGIASSQKSRQLQGDLKTLREKKTELDRELQALEGTIKELKNSEIQEDAIEQELKKEIEKYELLSGYKEGRGPGIVVRFQEQASDRDSSILIYNYELLLSIINKLNASGAEGIAINEERYVISTEFRLSGDRLFINGNPVYPPFEIRAIGNPDTLESGLNLRYGIIWEMRKNYNINSSIEKREDVVLPRYSKKIEYKYATPVESGR